MVQADLDYILRLLTAKVIDGPVLELGTGYEGSTCREIIVTAGLSYFGTDMKAGPNVDFVANFEYQEDLSQFQNTTPFASILLLNVLEHTFDPIRILDNATTLLRPGGCLIAVTPAIWPLHDFPMDAWRPLPNFFEEYAKRRNLELEESNFEYIGHGLVSNFRNTDGSYAFPPPCASGLHRWKGRVIHRLFDTFGRSMRFPSHLGVGCVLRTDADPKASIPDVPRAPGRNE